MSFSLGGLVSSVLGGFANSAFSSASSAKAMELQYEYQKKLAEQQNQYNVENYQHRHQWETDDLRAAGLNPILSANSGGSVAGAGLNSVGLAVGSAGDVSSAYQSYKKLTEVDRKQIELQQEANQIQRSSVDNQNTNRTREIDLQTSNSAVSNKIAQARLELETVLGKGKLENEKAVAAAQIENLRKQGDAAMVQALASSTNASTNQYNAHTAERRAISDIAVNAARVNQIESEIAANRWKLDKGMQDWSKIGHAGRSLWSVLSPVVIGR
ncbi:DNA pilot protein [Peromfec virus RodF7_16]|uniref:DNA pilot protein n=1 Tax=Peromfec virus RodF7_16 TaxID=2929351 RepID=A0A976N2P4_9VIRU|nr:DNA pilot protein [Peromfec virus RodF7_16]